MWASAWGEDEFGAFACFEAAGVEQRMRWIERGTFRMGSPEGEEGRFGDEGPQHEVTLSQGCWLADTPCTQALWVAVMGDNPSAYPSPQRPVEKVSWDDVQRFLEKLNDLVPGLGARLPTEAEWEHACRAGTKGATYGVLDDVAWYSGNGGGDTTRDVGHKLPNDWGLYDMLGNVYEWCADGYRQYISEPVTDPEGFGPKRVYRGGSWSNVARSCRAAFRLWFGPGYRGGNLGFRLSRGQSLRQSQPGPEAPTAPTRK